MVERAVWLPLKSVSVLEVVGVGVPGKRLRIVFMSNVGGGLNLPEISWTYEAKSFASSLGCTILPDFEEV